jgi:sugar lactone lactonase YvrE
MAMVAITAGFGAASASAARQALSGSPGSIAVIAGVNTSPPVLPTPINAQGVAVDSAGNVYIADTYNEVVEKVSPSGVPSVIAGEFGSAGAPTQGPARSSKLNTPFALAVDSSGNVFIADRANNVVEKVTPTGTLSIVAGTGTAGAPTPGPATSSELSQPLGVAVDSGGNLYISDSGNDVVEKVNSSGTLSVYAGVVGTVGVPTPGPATSSDLNQPAGLAIGSGNLYIADYGNDTVEKVDMSTGSLSIIAGVPNVIGRAVEGPATSSDLWHPTGVAVDSSGTVYIGDQGNDVVEKVAAGALSFVAGYPGLYGAPSPGSATASHLKYPYSVALDPSGNLYIADFQNNVVEKVNGSTLSIFATQVGPVSGLPTPGPATSSELNQPFGIAVDASGNAYIADASNDAIEKVTPTGTLSVLAGVPGTAGTPTAGPATGSDLKNPLAVALDASGNVYIADTGNAVVEKVTPSGSLSVIAGVPGSAGLPTPGRATNSKLDHPAGVAVDGAGNVYISDTNNSDVAKVTPSGTLSVIAGVPGKPGGPIGGPATSSHLGMPLGLALDASGAVYIADSGNEIVEKVTPSGTLSVIAGVPGTQGLPTPGPATNSDLSRPIGVAVDGAGNVYIGDASNSVVEKVTPPGTLSIIAGTPGTPGVPTPGPVSGSDLGAPAGVAVDHRGNLYITDLVLSDVEEVFGVAALDTTSTQVACAPMSLALGAATTCTATVRDTGGQLPPTGTIRVSSSPATGSFSATGCSLVRAASGGASSCQVVFKPGATGSYTVSASYAGDASHQASGGHSAAIAVTHSSGPGVAAAGHAHVSGSSVSIPVSCSAAGPCRVTVTLSVRETIQRGKVIAIAATSVHRTVVIGSKSVTIAAGHHVTVKVSLNARGRRLLASRQRLRAKLTVAEGHRTVKSSTVTLTARHRR